jgi:hypothetical protein
VTSKTCVGRAFSGNEGMYNRGRRVWMTALTLGERPGPIYVCPVSCVLSDNISFDRTHFVT